VIFFMVCSLLALVACFAVKRSGAADSAPGQWEGEHSRGAHAPSVKA